MKMPKAEISINNIDKLYHLFAYFVLSSCWLFSFYKKPALKYIIILFCIIYGIIIEVLQDTLTLYRTGDFKDVLANTLGIILGLLVFNQFLKKINYKS
jgi:VanZ family protein